MKVLILTSSLYGTAAHHLPLILESKTCDVVVVIYNRGVIANKRRHYVRKLKKIIKIGALGAINGIRMRKWFEGNDRNYLSVRKLDEICVEHEIPFHVVDSINCEETRALFRKSNADLGISLGNGYIARNVFSIPQYGMINIHHEKLPEYQNAQPVLWQLFNGSTNSGYTIHKIDSRIDTGEILLARDVPIIFGKTLADTVARTCAELLKQSASGLVTVLQHFEELYQNAKPQGSGRSYTTPSIWQFVKIYRNYKRLRNR